MTIVCKRKEAIRALCPVGATYPFEEAVRLLKEVPAAKFSESVDVAIQLGVDPRKSDQMVRGATVLPHGTGKTVRVAVFAQGTQAEAAMAAGADIVGMEELAQQIQSGKIEFDILIATPDTMGLVGRLGPILGPRGLMPNPKVGTVTMDAATAVKNAKSGQAQYRTDKGGIIHCLIGKVDFEATALKETVESILVNLKRLKPTTAKGVYVKKVTLSTTMGPGLVVTPASLVF